MLINADLTKRVVIHTPSLEWVPSPLPGVERRMLDRHGAESGRATSMVRYAPGSSFKEHTHVGGEEFLVLEGVFSDERGDFPAGSYVRNPIGSKHTPFCKDGCIIFVKLHQFDEADTVQKTLDTNAMQWESSNYDGVTQKVLHEFGNEHVSLFNFSPGAQVSEHVHEGGSEALVLSGDFSDAEGHYKTGDWIRNPDGSAHAPYTNDGCVMYVKTGHLPRISKA